MQFDFYTEVQEARIRRAWRRAYYSISHDPSKISFPPFVWRDKDNWITCWPGEHVPLYIRLLYTIKKVFTHAG